MDELNYCSVCGTRLTKKECGDEGLVDYCEKCRTFKFPMYSSAVSMVVFNKDKNKILLIQQYGSKDNILVAGYINKGETPQQALKREIKEEVNLNAISWNYNNSMYFNKTNTLIHNFVVVVDSESFLLKKNEVDSANWYTVMEAVNNIKPNSIAETFLLGALKVRGYI